MTDTVQGHEVVGGAAKRGAPDPSVKLPDGVKAAADRANALSAQAKQARDDSRSHRHGSTVGRDRQTFCAEYPSEWGGHGEFRSELTQSTRSERSPVAIAYYSAYPPASATTDAGRPREHPVSVR